MYKHLTFICLILFLLSCKNESIEKTPNYIKMDFSFPRTLIYDFHQKQLNIDNDFKDTTHTITTCEIVLNSTLDTTGILVFRDMVLNTVNNHSTDTITRKVESQAIENFNEFGENSDHRMLTHRFQSIFPLPYRNTSDSAGTFVFDVEMPINTYGPLIYIPGKCTFTILDTLRYKNELCYKVHCSTLFKHIDKVDAIEGIYDCNIKFEFDGYYNVKDCYYVDGNGVVHSDIIISLPSHDKHNKYLEKEMKSTEKFNYQLKTKVQ